MSLHAMPLLGVNPHINSFTHSFLPTTSINQIALPSIDPPFSEAFQDQVFSATLPHRISHYRQWSPGWIPESCLEEATFNKLPGSDFSVRDIWYEDCAAGWTVCRHKKAKESWDSVISTLGQVPVGMRQYVANLVILPSAMPDSTSAIAYTRASVLVFTPAFFKLGVLFHEISHILDTSALPLRKAVREAGYPDGTSFSHTEMWTSALGNDTAVTTPYARSSLEESFADAGRWAMSDLTTPGGLDGFSSGWGACRNQIREYERWLGEVVFPKWGECTGKVASSPAVEVRVRGWKKKPGEKPVSALRGSGVEEIVLPAGVEGSFFVHRGPVPDW